MRGPRLLGRAALLLAAWGAGPLSIDRTILKREF